MNCILLFGRSVYLICNICPYRILPMRVWWSGVHKFVMLFRLSTGAQMTDYRMEYSVSVLDSFLTLCTHRQGGMHSSRWTRVDT